MFKHLKLICWKIYVIRKRHKILTIAESVVPILLFLLIAYGRSKISGMNKMEITETAYTEVITEDSLMRSYFSMDEHTLLAYTPVNNFTDNIMRRLQEKLIIPTSVMRPFISEEKFMEEIAHNPNNEVYAIKFYGNDPKKLDYSIGIYKKRWHTNTLFHQTFETPTGGSDQYFYGGFITLQMALDSSFIELSGNINKLPFTFTMQEFPYPPHVRDNALSDMFMYILPLITIFSFIFLCPALIKRAAEERFTGIKEYMKMVGMKPWVLWFGWFLHALSTNIISIIVIVFLMKTALWGAEYPTIEHCDATVFFVFLLLYCIAAISFCFFISMLFKRPTIAMVFGILVWILSYFIPNTFVNNCSNMSWRNKMFFGIFPNMALYFGYDAIAIYEKRGIGVDWTNLSKSAGGGFNDITMKNVFLMFLFDTFLFITLTFYLENVNPGEYGIAKPFYYPITDVWHLIKRSLCKKSSQIQHETVSLNNVEKGIGPVGIEIDHLYKKFGTNVAVVDLNMSIYKNQITVLLGHNGAGKTTTMSMITGMTSATAGSITINGINVNKNIDKVRKTIGLCTQHNLFFADFTVIEHLIFFSMLKGRSYKEARMEVTDILRKLNMLSKCDEKTNKLSGGMKRKLCLGMAIVGGSKVLILDEPTSGMDPESRREVWNLLLEWRKTKTILITTHFMEEADVLGDWIAIMANGKLQDYGTPMGLKKKYATGYHLSLLLDSFDHLKEIENLVKQNIIEAELLRQNGMNLVFMLPLEEKPRFSNLFEKLDNQMNELKINNISITVTTLEEVFLKSKSENNEISTAVDSDLKSLKNPSNSEDQQFPSFPAFQSLIYKRFYFMMRKYLLYLPSVFLCIFLTLLAIHLGEGNNNYYGGSEPELNLNLAAYGQTTIFYGGTPISNESLKKLKEYYGSNVAKQGNAQNVSQVSDEIIKKGIENIVFYQQHIIVGAEFNETDKDLIVNSMYSPLAFHGAPISLNLVMDAVAKTLLGVDYSITAKNKPITIINNGNSSPNELSDVQIGILWLTLVPIGLLFLMGNFIVFPINEISTKFMHLQIMCGISSTTYWLTNFGFDYILYLIIILFKLIFLFVVTTFLYDSTPYGIEEIGVLLCIWMAFGFAGIPFSYLFTYKKTIAGGFALLLMIGIFLSIVPTVIVGAMENSGDKYYENIGDILKNIFIIFLPNFSVTYILVKFARKAVNNYNWLIMSPERKKTICWNFNEINPCCRASDSLECYQYQNYFGSSDLDVKWDICKMILGGIIYIVIIIFLHSFRYKIIKEGLIEFLRKIKGISSCCAEKSKTNKPAQKTASLSAYDIEKYYMFKKVVKKVSFEVNLGECYGLLGVNGAGKTTTFRTLTRDLILNRGEVIVHDKDDKDIKIGENKYLEKIGYCPQYDALNLNLTGKELLKVFAILRGYPTSQADKVVDSFITIFDLEKYADKQCSFYSGGNKRKLSLALAFVGFPQNILLDEPTNGVDPASRRKFWNTLSKIQKNEHIACILSSHSMEECEALCHRIGIMKNGEIKAEGTLPTLKKKFQSGFNVVFKLKPKSNNQDKVLSDLDIVDGSDCVDGSGPSVQTPMQQHSVKCFKQKFEKQFDKAELKDEHSGILYYHIDDNKRLSKLFKIIENIKSEFDDIVEDYSISATSLEDVFLSVAREDS